MADIDKDLDSVIRTGAGRRLICRLVAPAGDPIPHSHEPLTMAYNVARSNMARELDDWVKDVNLQCWLLMHREANADNAGETILEDPNGDD